MEKEDKIIRLKAEIFDLQVQYGLIRNEMEGKIKELNILNGKTELPPEIEV